VGGVARARGGRASGTGRAWKMMRRRERRDPAFEREGRERKVGTAGE
jgi:hypothetical protein